MLSNNKRTGLRSSQEAVQSEGDTNRAVFAPTSMVLLVLSCDFVWKRTTYHGGYNELVYISFWYGGRGEQQRVPCVTRIAVDVHRVWLMYAGMVQPLMFKARRYCVGTGL